MSDYSDFIGFLTNRKEAAVTPELTLLERAKELRLKHLGSQHNQQRHGWRFGGGLETVQRTSKRLEGGERERYQKRAMSKLSGGSKPDKGGKVDKPQPKPSRGEVKKPTAVSKPVEKPEAPKVSGVAQKAKEAREGILAIDDKNGAKIKQLEKKVIQSGGTRPDLAEKLKSLKEQAAAEQRKRLYVDDPANIKAAMDKSMKGKDLEETQAGIDGFNKLVSKSVIPNGESVGFNGVDGRSHYSEDSVKMRKGAGASVAVHELGHWLEEKNPTIRNRVHNFLNERTKGESNTTMNQATGSRFYGSNEITRTDKFMDAYMGKQYMLDGRRFATEILSMGIEMFYANPAKLARQDPEYFDFIYGLLRGE